MTEPAPTTTTASATTKTTTVAPKKPLTSVSFFGEIDPCLSGAERQRALRKLWSDKMKVHEAEQAKREEADKDRDKEAPPRETRECYVMTPEIRQALERASLYTYDDHEKRRFAVFLTPPRSKKSVDDDDPEWIPRDVLDEVVDVLDGTTQPVDLEELLQGTRRHTPVFRPNPNHDALVARREKFRQQDANRAYRRMVDNVDSSVLDAAPEPVSTFKSQIALGLDTIMVALLGGGVSAYWIGTKHAWSPVKKSIAITLAITGILMVDAILIIIKFNKIDEDAGLKPKKKKRVVRAAVVDPGAHKKVE